jgi:uncharacterized protein (UPF0548 family)
MLLVSPGNSRSMQRLVDHSRRAEPNYADVGASLGDDFPPGFHHDRYERSLGRGSEVFQHAKRGLQTWQAHKVPGVRVAPPGTEIEPGATVIVTLGLLVALAVPCRIVEVVDQPKRWGFAYGTLPGHPEEGEESFVVTWADDDTVRFSVQAFSRPADRLGRLAAPLGRRLQQAGSARYLIALQRYVDQRTPN